MKNLKSILFFLPFLSLYACAQKKSIAGEHKAVITGAERIDTWLPALKSKAVAVFANQTSIIGNTHLVDSLVKRGVNVVKIFGPEHGFRGTADAGEEVNNGIDKRTGLPIISLYGNHKKPTAEDLKNVDAVIYDIQDVGVRFYTYISSLEYLMQSVVENKKELLILDRPNPNGFYVDGPVLEDKFKSFIGMQNVPVVYGMTPGEYAQMIALENKITATDLFNVQVNIDDAEGPTATFDYMPGRGQEIKGDLKLTVIKCKNYDHSTKYILPVNPSPNLREMQSVYLFPSIAFIEGTVLSEGRGTDKPFQIFGHPNLPKNLYSFTPKPNEGAKSSKNFYKKCYGWNLSGSKEEVLKNLNGRIDLSHLIKAYKLFPGKDSFFLANNFLNKLAGNDVLMKQIKKGMSEKDIRKSWEPGIAKFKAIRKKYLLYKDFE